MLASLIVAAAVTARHSAERGELTLELFVSERKSSTRRPLSVQPNAVLLWSGDTAPSALSRRKKVVVPTTFWRGRGGITAPTAPLAHYAHVVLSWRGPSSQKNRVIARQSVPLTQFWWVRDGEGGRKKQSLYFNPLLRLLHIEEPPPSRSRSIPPLWEPLMNRFLVLVRLFLSRSAHAHRYGLNKLSCTASAAAARERATPQRQRLDTLEEVAPLWRASNESRGRALVVDTFWALDGDLIAIEDDAVNYTL